MQLPERIEKPCVGGHARHVLDVGDVPLRLGPPASDAHHLTPVDRSHRGDGEAASGQVCPQGVLTEQSLSADERLVHAHD